VPFFTRMSNKSSCNGWCTGSFCRTTEERDEACDELEQLQVDDSRLRPALVPLSGEGAPSTVSGMVMFDRVEMLVPANVEPASGDEPPKDWRS